MFIVVTGGSGSGKSAFAEEKVLELSTSNRVYLATMMCFDEESKGRVQRHRKMRREKEFTTIERYVDLQGVEVLKGSTILLECMSNLVANEMFDLKGAGDGTVDAIIKGLNHLKKEALHVIIVTNEVFSDGIEYTADTLEYQKNLGEINQRMGEMADQVVEVVYGIPIYNKRGAGRI